MVPLAKNSSTKIREGFDEIWNSKEYMMNKDLIFDPRNRMWGAKKHYFFEPDQNFRPGFFNPDYDFHKPKYNKDKYNRWNKPIDQDKVLFSVDSDGTATLELKDLFKYLVIILAICAILTMIMGQSRKH